MDPLKSILRNSSLLIAAQVVASTFGMALIVLLPRFLGDAEFGRLHLALSLTMMLGVAVELGLTQAVARAVARERGLTRPYLRSVATLIGVAGAVLYAALLAAVRLVGYPEEVAALVTILGVAMAAEALSQALAALFQAHEQMLVPAVARIASNALVLALAAPLLLRGHGAGTVAILIVVGALLRVIVQGLAVRRLDGFRAAAPVAPAWRGVVAAGFPFLVWQALGMFYYRVDVVILGWMTTDATVGWYGAASRLLDALGFIPQFLTMAVFPVAARLWVASTTEFRATTRKTLHLLLVVTVPVAVTLLVLAEELVGFLFTLEGFGPSVPVLRIQAVTLALLFVDFYLVCLLMAVGRERSWIGIAAAGCLLSPTLNWLLIPLADARLGNGGIGAAVAMLVTEAFIMANALRLLPRGTFGWESGRVALLAVGAGALLAALLLVGRVVHVPWPLAAGIGAVGYLALVVRLRLVDEDITRWVRGLLTRRPSPETA